MIPVWVAPSVKTHVAAYLIVGPLDELADHLCPVCERTLGEGRVALVYVGRRPGNRPYNAEYFSGPWAAVAVPIHVACTDAEEGNDDA